MPAHEHDNYEVTGAVLMEKLLNDDPWLSIPQCAALLSVTPRTIKERVKDGSLVAENTDGPPHERRISLVALARFVEARERMHR